MVWTVSQNATTLTITPDGTSSENLTTVLDLAISTLGVNAGVTKSSLYTYETTKKILIAADTSTNYLYVSGLNLTLRNQFIRAANSRVRFGNVNAANTVVGKPNIIIYNAPNNGYDYPPTPFTVNGSNALVDATDLTLIFRRTSNIDGSVVNGYDVAGLSVGSFSNCSFQSDSDGDSSNALFFFSAEAFTNCTFTGWSGCELSSPGIILKNCTFTKIGTLSSGVSGSYHLEQISSARFKVLRSSIGNLIDCNISTFTTNQVTHESNAGNQIILKNSLQLLGQVNEANGLFVVRLPNNTQVYKRTFSALGLISGNNAIGASDGISSSSERLLIPVQKHGVSGADQVVVFDYRGTWEGVFVRYGRLPNVFSFNLQGTTATLQNVPFSSLPDTGITVVNPATVAAYTTISINHSTGTVTLSGATTQRQLHDYCALEKAGFADSGLTVGGNPVPKACLPVVGSPIYNRSVGTFLYNLSFASGATLTGADSVVLAAGKNVTLAVAGDYTTSIIETSSTSNVLLGTTTAEALTFDFRTWTFANGAAINLINTTTGTAIVTVAADQLINVTAGARVTIQAPQAFVSAPNFAQNARVQVARLEPYSVPSTEIDTAINAIAIAGNRFKSAAPSTLIYFQLQAGASIPATSPQITHNTLYYVQAAGVADGLTAGQFRLSLTQGGTAIVFSNQGSGNFFLTGITELDNSLAGASGYSMAFTEPNNTLLRVSAQFWQNTAGCTATTFYQQNIAWNAASGNAIADTVNVNSNPDAIHNSLIGNSIKVFGANVTLPVDGSTVTGISFNAQGVINLDPRLFTSVAGFPTLTPQSAYLYTTFFRSTAAGIRVIGNQFMAQDAANFVFSGLTLDNIADGIRNTPNTSATIAGGFVATSNGSNPIRSGSGAIYLNADARGVAITTTSGATISPTQQQIRDASALALTVTPVAGSIDSKLALIPTSPDFTTNDRAKLDGLSVTLASPGVFSTSSLANAPSGGGGTTDWTTTERGQIRKRLGIDGTAVNPIAIPDLALGSAVSVIPLNPLLTTDTRLNNLDATIGSRATQSSVNTNATTISAIKVQTDKFVFTAANRVDSTAIGVPTNPLLVTDGRLNFIDASIAANAPANIWSFTGTRSLTTPFPSVPSASQNADAVRINLTPELGRIDRSVSSVFTVSDRANLAAIPTITYVGILSAIQASVNGLPTLTAIEGSIVLFKSSNYTAPDNAGIESLNTKITTVRAGYLDGLTKLDASITSRATPDQVWAVPYSGLTGLGTVGRLLHRIGKAFGMSSANVTASDTARTTADGDIDQTITTNPDGSKTMSGSP